MPIIQVDLKSPDGSILANWTPFLVRIPDSTPIPIPPDPTPQPPAGGDMLDLSKVRIWSSPADIAAWPITRSIKELRMAPSGSGQFTGLSFVFNEPLPDAWKWPSNPQNPSENFQFTVWAGSALDGSLQAAAFIQMWQGRPATGAPILTDFHRNWAYSARWGGLNLYMPKVGDQMFFLVSAGNGRDQSGVTSVRERSNVVLVSLPTGDEGRFTF